MDLPIAGEEGSLRNANQPEPPEGLNANQNVSAVATADDARRDGDNKFQSAISAWRGIESTVIVCKR